MISIYSTQYCNCNIISQKNNRLNRQIVFGLIVSDIGSYIKYSRTKQTLTQLVYNKTSETETRVGHWVSLLTRFQSAATCSGYAAIRSSSSQTDHSTKSDIKSQFDSTSSHSTPISYPPLSKILQYLLIEFVENENGCGIVG